MCILKSPNRITLEDIEHSKEAKTDNSFKKINIKVGQSTIGGQSTVASIVGIDPLICMAVDSNEADKGTVIEFFFFLLLAVQYRKTVMRP